VIVAVELSADVPQSREVLGQLLAHLVTGELSAHTIDAKHDAPEQVQVVRSDVAFLDAVRDHAAALCQMAFPPRLCISSYPSGFFVQIGPE
jgi:hypothetical protein